ncbi:MAG: N-acetyltransferase family protein [Bacteriovoracia bacterium]
MEPISLKPATPADEAAVLEMATAFHLEDGHPLKPSSPDAIRSLLRGSELGSIFVIQRLGESIGYCALCFTMSLEFGGLVVILDDFFVQRLHRGQGAGRAALKQIEQIAKDKKAVQLFLEVENTNGRALNFYEGFGFKQRHRRMMDKRFS